MSSLKNKLANLPPLRRQDASSQAPAYAPVSAPVSAPVPEPAPETEAATDAAPTPDAARLAERVYAPKDAPDAAPALAARSPSPFGLAGMPSSSIGPRASLDELRDRIARIVARSRPVTPRADPTAGELPFVRELTDRGPLYVHRARSGAAARVGRAPLVAGRDADAAMLALLALDPGLAACDVRRALYLDTETTGLAGGTGTIPFLIGLATYDEDAGAFLTEQVLLRRLGEEAPMLALLAERIERASMIITYNGKAFDMPLLRTRYVMNRMQAPPARPHLDLVHVARRVHKTRLPAKTLSSLEHNLLGRVRVGDTHGEDIVACYAHFLRTGDDEALIGVVDHNAADVLAMVALVGLYGEPLGSLEGEDLAGVARTVRRAGALDLAADLADQAVLRGGGPEARRARGEIAKARGDKALALADYEAIAREVDDPAARLELAKLYEHHVKSFAKALALVDEGTGEDDDARTRRRARLKRKLDRSS